MTYAAYAVTAAALICLISAQWVWASLYRAQIREHARERNLMLNQLLHLAGRTWQPPPSVEQIDPDADRQALEAELALLDPSQLPYP